MNTAKMSQKPTFDSIDDPLLNHALNEFGRSINLVTTYGKNHPAALKALQDTATAMEELFTTRRKAVIGAFNGVMTIDEKTVTAVGTLQKSLERRLVRLHITGLKIARGIGVQELTQLSELLSSSDAETFQQGLSSSRLDHIESENTQYQAVREGQTVANESDLSGMGGHGVLVLEDEHDSGSACNSESQPQVEQIVAFLKGDLDADAESVGEELTELASDPARLGQMIMESVSIRQSVSELAGESLNDIILGCLRRTYDGLRKQPAFQSSTGKAELKKALLMLEENLLNRMRDIAGDEDPELDRQIVQAIREMDDNLSFEMAAAEYMEHTEAMQQSKQQLRHYIQVQGAGTAESLLEGSGFPNREWRKIVVESGSKPGGSTSSLSDGLSTLTAVFEKLENLMKSETANGNQVKDLLGRANENLDGTLDTAREKLTVLSQQIRDGQISTIGGQAHMMSRAELLNALAEVAQELMQPLTAINASLEMMLYGYVGKITEEQSDMLTLASNSGEHLKYLMDMLIDIVGCPTNKGIDSRYHMTSEQVVLMKEGDQRGQDDDDIPYRKAS